MAMEEHKISILGHSSQSGDGVNASSSAALKAALFAIGCLGFQFFLHQCIQYNDHRITIIGKE